MRTIFLWTAGLLLFVSAAQADIEYWKVVEVTGPAEIKSPSAPGWQNLSAPSYLKRGSLVRTGKDASVDLCLDRRWEGFLRLNENSELDLAETPLNQVRLKKGSLFALLEAESGPAPLSVRTPDTSVQLSLGGVTVAVASPGTVVKVFSESAQVSDPPKTVTEGWEWTAAGPRRLDFLDYDEWQRWYRKNYDRKDNFFLKRSP